MQSREVEASARRRRADHSGLTRGPGFVIAMTGSFAAAMIDLAAGVVELDGNLGAAAAGAAATLVVVLAGLALGGWLLRRRRRGDTAAVAPQTALAAGAVAVTGFFALHDPLSGAFLSGLLTSALGLCLVGAAVAGAWLAVEGSRARPLWRKRLTTLVLAVPVAFGAVAAAAWLHHGTRMSSAAIAFLVGLAAAVSLVLVSLPWVRSRAPFGFAVSGTLLTVFGLTALPIQRPQPPGDDEIGAGLRTVLITVDSLRADAVSLTPGASGPTPHLAALSREGVTFTRARSEGCWTLPGLASIMTGVPPTVHDLVSVGRRLPSSLDSLAEFLDRAGLATVSFGYNPVVAESTGLTEGFREFHWFPPGPPTFGMRTVGSRILAGAGRTWWPEREHTEKITDRAVRWLETNSARPFFLWVHYYDPHLPYEPPARYRPPAEAPPRIGYGFDDALGVRLGYFKPSRAERQWIRALYDAEVRYVDDNIGRLLATLRRLGLYEEALIVVASDHGEEFWDHGSFEHGHTVHDELLRVPLVVKPPGPAEPTTVKTAVSTASIFNTVLELNGFAPREGGETARSLVGCWDPRRSCPSTPVVVTGTLYYEDRIALVERGFKYVRWLVSGAEELYDLEADPKEERSLVATSPAVLEEARRTLRRYLERAVAARERLGLQDADSTRIDPASARALRSLGYIR